jgi:beta-galactosidase/beta-glucuronidase
MNSSDEISKDPTGSELRLGKMARREFLLTTAGAGAASVLAGDAAAMPQEDPEAGRPAMPSSIRPSSGLLRPLQNAHRNLTDLSGFWQFQLDPEDAGEKSEWFRGLPSPRTIAVPCSWNDLFDDAQDYMGAAWHLREAWVPHAWRGQRILLYFGSVNYAARVWLNGAPLGEHEGGHLPFAFDISEQIEWDRPNLIAVRVENIQTATRVPPGGDSGMGLFSGFPSTHYDFFPYCGIHRQVEIVSMPKVAIEDVTVVTKIDGSTGIVELKAGVSGSWNGTGKASLGTGAGSVEEDLHFRNGQAAATLRLPEAKFWGPSSPHLYPLHLTLTEGGKSVDSYSLNIGIRTIEVRGDQLLLNGQPVFLKGCAKHEDFPINGRGLNVPLVVRDAELLKWMGANSYRTSHYPYSEEAMETADREGFLIIDEIPAVGMSFSDGETNIGKRQAQCLQDIDDLIARDKNHPCVVIWSVANEPSPGNIMQRGPNSKGVEAGSAFFTKLFERAHMRDSTRPATFTSVQGGPREWIKLADVACLNLYFGWYSLGGRLDEAAVALGKELDSVHDQMHKPIIITECGAEAIAGTHATPAQMWTEEYQVEYLRRYLEVVGQRPFMAGIHVWNFANFKTSQSIVRAQDMNQKGVLTRDRQPKMGAHFLRSKWKT